MNTTEMMVICREVDRATGKIAVYRIETEVTESLIFKLRLRARLNPELQYFVTTKAHYLDVDSTYFQLSVGDNLYRYSAEENLENLEVSIYHDDLYLGV